MNLHLARRRLSRDLQLSLGGELVAVLDVECGPLQRLHLLRDGLVHGETVLVLHVVGRALQLLDLL